MAGESGELNSELAVHKLSLAVSTLTEIVGQLRTDVSRMTVVTEQLSVRCGAVEKSTSELQRYLFTGNGQPALSQQLVAVRTQLDQVLRDFKDSAHDHVTSQRLTDSEHLFATKLGSVERTVEEMQKQQETHAASRLSLIVAIVGGALGIVSAAITAWASLAATK